MAKHQWQPGESGNPKGAPPKARRLTRALELAVNRTLPVGDKRVSGRILLANILRDLAIFGKSILPDGESLSVDPKTQVDIAKFIYAQVDGAPKAELDLTSNGQQMGALPIVAIDYRTLAADVAPRPVGDPEPSG